MKNSEFRIQNPVRLGTLALVLMLAACGEESQRVQLAATPQVVPTSMAASNTQASSKPAQPASAAAQSSPAASAIPNSQFPVPKSQFSIPNSAHALPTGSRLQIPSIGVDAPLVTMGVDANGVMQVPDNGTDVAWYSFSAVPGTAGNAVLSGHVDTATSYTAVFTRLKELKPGSAMDVLENGKKTDFEVFWAKAWTEATAPLPLILGNAPSATLTLITCAGTFDRSVRNYTERLVVRAKLPGSL